MYDFIHVHRRIFCLWQVGLNAIMEIFDNQISTVDFATNFLIAVNNLRTVKLAYSEFL